MSEFVLEQIVKKSDLDIQWSFSTKAARLLQADGRVVAQATQRGLRLLANTERSLDDALAYLRRYFDDDLLVQPARVRYREGEVLEEPIMSVLVRVPLRYQGLVSVNLSMRRAVVTESLERGAGAEIRALVPMVELLGYEPDLALLTDRAAELEIGFSHYAPSGPGPFSGDSA